MKNVTAKITIYLLISISIFFNGTVGFAVLAPLFMKVLMSLAYASLDYTGFLISEKVTLIKSFWLRQLAKATLLHIVLLSIFAAYTANVIIDVTSNYTNYQNELKTLNEDIEHQKDQAAHFADLSKRNVANRRTQYNNTSQEHLVNKRQLVEERQALTDSAPTPPNQAVFEKIVADFDLPITPEKLQNIVRANFGFAVVWAGLLLSLIHSDSKKSKKRKSVIHRWLISLILNKPKKLRSEPENSGTKKSINTLSVADLEKYEKIKTEVENGMNINYQNIKGFGVGTEKAKAIINKLEKEGVIIKVGRTYHLKDKLKNKKPKLELVG